MLSQMEEAEQRRLRACGLDYIGLAMQITVKAANFQKERERGDGGRERESKVLCM